MLPDPLHPALVHFPIALAILLPLTALGVMVYLVRRGPSRPAWLLTVALAGMLAGSTWLAVETGEEQEEVVEAVLASEAPLHQHEERANQFLIVTVAVLGLALVGLIPGRLGTVGRLAAVIGSFALIPAGFRVGESGGDLVYRYGAAQAYVGRTPATIIQAHDAGSDGH